MRRSTEQSFGPFMVAVLGVGCFALMDATVKWLVMASGLVVVSIWRSLLNLAISGSLYLPWRRSWPSAAIVRIHITRGLVVAASAALFFWGLGRVPLAEGVALTFIAPLIAQLLSGPLLNEAASPRSIVGAVTAFAGVLLIALQRHSDLGGEMPLGSAAVLASAILYGGNLILMRRQALAAEPREINFFQSVTIAGCWWAYALINGLPAWPKGSAFLLVSASLLSSSAGLLLAWAYRRAVASYLAVTEYSAFLWATALGWTIFHEPLSVPTIMGTALIVIGCLLAMQRKSSSEQLELA